MSALVLWMSHSFGQRCCCKAHDCTSRLTYTWQPVKLEWPGHPMGVCGLAKLTLQVSSPLFLLTEEHPSLAELIDRDTSRLGCRVRRGWRGWVARGNEMKNEMTKKERTINMAECSLSIWIMAAGIITAVVELSGRGQSQLHYLIHSRLYSSVKWITVLVKRKRTFSLCLWHRKGCVIRKDTVCQSEIPRK